MELPRKQDFAYWHKKSVVGNFDRGRFIGHIQYNVVVGHQDKFCVVQNQHRLVKQDKFGKVGIVVVDIVATMVVDVTVVVHQFKFDQAVNKLYQYKPESSELMVNWPEVVGFHTQMVVVRWLENTDSVDQKLEGQRLKDQLAKVVIQSTELVTMIKS